MGIGNGIVPWLRLNNGVAMPQLGLGVWQAHDGEEVERAVGAALDAGYRLIDTAAIYGNEDGVGNAIRNSGVPREEIFVTSKLWNNMQAYDDAIMAFEATLARLQLEYLDLYLIHWPMPSQALYTEAWRALEKLHADGRIRAIGVSNFKPAHLETLLTGSTVTPAVNQIELHPKFQQAETRAYCNEHGIAVESYSPLMRGGEILEHPVIVQLAAMHKKSPAQIVLRWHMQQGLIAIPKSVTSNRIVENIDIFDFELSFEDMQLINGLDEGRRIAPDPDNL
jgi:diketogulonate reductase-like aldo/keto reductase